MNKSTAILLFTRTAAEEALFKNFDPSKGFRKNRAISSSLISKSVKEANKSGLDVFSCYSTNQEGDSFGDRLSNALSSVFNQGYENIIAIGSDCPDISAQLLKKADEELNKGNTVIGPASDGGIYLLGLQKESFNPKTFKELPWQTAKLGRSLQILLAEEEKTVFTLNTLSDIDNFKDLKKFLSSKVDETNLKLKEVLSNTPSFNYLNSNENILNPDTYSSWFLRGPPHLPLP